MKKIRTGFQRKGSLGKMLTAACFAVLTVAGSAKAQPFNDGLNHPFSPRSILYYQVVAAPRWVDGVFVGGATGIQQGAHGDCWFESAMAAIARTQPGARLISDMITGSSGGYEVRFLDQPTVPYAVTSTEITNTHVRDNAEWADVLEAALIKRFPALRNGKVGAHKVGHSMGEPTPEFGFGVLTGHQATLDKLSDMSFEDVAQTLERNKLWRIPMTASTPQTLPVQAVVTSHVYTILDYQPYSHMITLRNPWGKNTSKEFPNLPQVGETKYGVHDLGNGVIEMHLSAFTRYYSAITWDRVFHV